MTAQVITTVQDTTVLSNSAGTDAAVVFTVKGGTYALIASATWGGGSLDLQLLGPDATTFISVLAATVTANKFQTLTLPPGQYKFVNATATAIYAILTRINRGAGA